MIEDLNRGSLLVNSHYYMSFEKLKSISSISIRSEEKLAILILLSVNSSSDLNFTEAHTWVGLCQVKCQLNSSIKEKKHLRNIYALTAAR